MRVAFDGTLDRARDAADSGALTELAADGFRAAYGRDPGDEERNTWRETLPRVLESVGGALAGESRVLLEYGLPFNDQRIDLLLVGGKDGTPAAHVVELKNWESSRASGRLRHFVEVGGGTTVHPSYQSLNYGGKLKNLHSFGSQMSVTQSAVIADGGPDRHVSLFGPPFAELLALAPLYVAPELADFQDKLRSHLPEPPKSAWVDEIVNGRYTQSVQLLETLRHQQRALLQRSTQTLASCGWGLSKPQLEVLDEIMCAIQTRERAIFCVSGGPGSGKSLLAMHVFLGAVGLQQSSILAVRNNRLNAALREILDRSMIGAQGMVKYFSTGTAGVEDDAQQVADVLVCDEGQRLALRSANVLLRAPVIVILYDEAQILNEAERGTAENIFDLCSPLGLEPRFRTLPTPHRCRGGYAYLRWVESLLAEPHRAAAAQRVWSNDYDFDVVASAPELIARLRYPSGRVGLLASFTRASGREDKKNARDLGSIRLPETQPPVRWLMEPKLDYVPFYLDGRSNQLDRCASIYGAQGFELDYAGLVWGSDFVFRGGKWSVGDPDDCYDRVQGARALSTIMRNEPKLALELLKNRYRILLTRGIFGTAVYCEDQETRSFFQEMFNKTAKRGS